MDDPCFLQRKPLLVITKLCACDSDAIARIAQLCPATLESVNFFAVFAPSHTVMVYLIAPPVAPTGITVGSGLIEKFR